MWLLWLTMLVQSAPVQADFQADGVKALDAKQYDKAVELFAQASAADPKDYAARFQLALAYSLLGKDAEAIPQYRAALELKPGLYEAEINLGICLLHVKDSAGALPYLKSAAAQKPKEFQPAFYLARALLEQGQWPEAAAAFTTASSLDAGSAASELGLGQALARQGLRTEAEPHFRKAIALDPANKDALLELASLYEQNHQADEAIAIYREFPENPGAQEHMGELLLEAGHADQAIAPLETAVTASPTAANRVALAQAYVADRQPDKADMTLSQAVASEPRNYDLRMFYGRTLRDQHKYAEAAPQFVAATQLQPDAVKSWNELSVALILSEQYPQALAALDRVRALGAETSAHIYSRALAYDHMHQLKEALANYNKFLETSQGKNPEEEFKARHRAQTIQHELGR
jgi:tetratricopeptide (TPR) repeat protein